MKKYQLPKEFATKWVEALRSGEYGQTREQLTDFHDNYCCLGVLCKILNISDEVIQSYNTFCIAVGDAWSPIRHLPKGLNYELHMELTYLNDREKLTFPEIANWIEKNVEFIEWIS